MKEFSKLKWYFDKIDDGSIEVESRSSKASTFRIILRCEQELKLNNNSYAGPRLTLLDPDS